MNTDIRQLRRVDLIRSQLHVQNFAPETRELTFSGARSLSFEDPVVPLTFKATTDDPFYSPAGSLTFEIERRSGRQPTTFDMAEQTRLHFKSSRSFSIEWIVG